MTTFKKVAYSLGSLGASLPGQAFSTYVIFFYVDRLKLPAAWMALAWRSFLSFITLSLERG